MPAERIAMRRVRDVLRLKAAGVSGNEIARRVGMAFTIAIDEVVDARICSGTIQPKVWRRLMRIVAIAVTTILLSTGLVAAQPAPASRGNTAVAPLAPGPAPRGNTATAPAPGAANEFKTETEAKSRCPTGNVVWMNLGSHVYHVPGTKDYGHTKRGAYMCQADADKIGRAAKDEKTTGR